MSHHRKTSNVDFGLKLAGFFISFAKRYVIKMELILLPFFFLAFLVLPLYDEARISRPASILTQNREGLAGRSLGGNPNANAIWNVQERNFSQVTR